MITKKKQSGVTFIGFVFSCGILIFFAFLAMRVWPLINEKMKVDNALNHVAARDDIASLSKKKIGSYLIGSFSIDDVDQFTTMKEMKDVFSVKKIKGKKKRLMQMTYEIRRPLISNLDVIMKYDKKIEIDGTGRE